MEELEKEIRIKEVAIGIIGANVGSTFYKTKSLEVDRYVKLIKQIAKKRIKYKRLTSVDWITKEIKVKSRTPLPKNQEEALLWILENEDFLIKQIEKLLKKFSKKL